MTAHQVFSLAAWKLTEPLIGHLIPSTEQSTSVDTKYMTRIPRLSVCLHSAYFEVVVFLVVDVLGLDQEIQVNLGRDGQRKLAGVAINIENKSRITIQIGERLVSNNWSPKK